MSEMGDGCHRASNLMVFRWTLIRVSQGREQSTEREPVKLGGGTGAGTPQNPARDSTAHHFRKQSAGVSAAALGGNKQPTVPMRVRVHGRNSDLLLTSPPQAHPALLRSVETVDQAVSLS